MTDHTAQATSPFDIPAPSRSNGSLVNWRLFDRVWHVTGSLALAPGETSDDAFARLAPLLDQPGTSHERSGDTLTFRKRDPAAQDKMAVYDGGTLRIEQGPAGAVLRWRLKSRALLLCFLAPLLFLAFGQFSIVLNEYEKPTAAEAAAEKKKALEQEKRNAERKLHPIDQFLGAPVPEKPKNDDKSEKDEKAKKEEAEEKHSPTPAYVFAALFAALYIAGRVIEDRRIRRRFRKSLSILDRS